MAEYFEISFIANKSEQFKLKAKQCLQINFNLSEGNNISSQFGGKEVIVTFIDSSDLFYEELCISLSEFSFNKHSFNLDLEVLSQFVEKIFLCCKDIKLALCSFEINGYLLAPVNKMDDINSELIAKFPISFIRQSKEGDLILNLNLNAQNIFS